MYCPDEAIRKHVSKSLGERVDNITEADLLKEINTVTLMSATQ